MNTSSTGMRSKWSMITNDNQTDRDDSEQMSEFFDDWYWFSVHCSHRDIGYLGIKVIK